MSDPSHRLWEERLAGLGRVAVASCGLVLVCAVAAGAAGALAGAAMLGPLSVVGIGLGAVMLRGGRRAATAAVAFGAVLAWLASADTVTRIELALLIPFTNSVVGIVCIVAAGLYCGAGCATLASARSGTARQPDVVSYRDQRTADERRASPRQDVVAAVVFTVVCALSLFSRCPRVK